MTSQITQPEHSDNPETFTITFEVTKSIWEDLRRRGGQEGEPLSLAPSEVAKIMMIARLRDLQLPRALNREPNFLLGGEEHSINRTPLVFPS